MTDGSYNVNRISAYASVELNMDVRNETFAARVEKELEEIIKNNCIQIIPENYFQHHGFLRRCWQRAAYETIRLIFFLFTFYFKQEKETGRD
jgi:cardiolipin synthase